MADDKKKTTTTEGDTGQRKPLENLTDLKTEATQQPATGPGSGKKRGPYKKKEKQPEPELVPEIELDNEGLKNIIQGASVALSQRFGPHWILPDDRAESLANAYDKVIQKYLPTAGPYMVEINAIMITGFWVLPAAYLTFLQIKQQKELEANPVSRPDNQETPNKKEPKKGPKKPLNNAK